MFSREGTGKISAEDLSLPTGNYFLYTENLEDGPMTATFEMPAFVRYS